MTLAVQLSAVSARSDISSRGRPVAMTERRPWDLQEPAGISGIPFLGWRPAFCRESPLRYVLSHPTRFRPGGDAGWECGDWLQAYYARSCGLILAETGNRPSGGSMMI